MKNQIRWIAGAVLAMWFAGAGEAADFTFYTLSDIHYGALQGANRDTPKSLCREVEVINTLPGTPWPAQVGGGVVAAPRAILMQGDLINDGARDDLREQQWAWYIADFGVNGEGRCKFPVFEGVGNHDVGGKDYVYNKIKERNLVRKKLGYINHISPNGYHYSWDWDGIHFINLNLFPGNEWYGEADTYGPGHDPKLSREFLEQDLREQVGDSGRPVVVMQHFRPVDENWWTYSAADKYHKVLQEYNVIAIIVGHQGGGPNNLWRGFNWISSNGNLIVLRVTPDNQLTAVQRGSGQWDAFLQKSIFLSYAASDLAAAINNGDWASEITATGATLSGKLLYQAVPATEVTLFWGTADGGTDPGRWEQTKPLGVKAPRQSFSASVKGLKPWTTYYYRCRAKNSKGEAWAQSSVAFSTSGVLPDGWQTAFIGYEQRPGGGATYADGTLTVRGSGRDIAEPGQPIDNFQYACRTLRGDGEIKCRVATMEMKSREPKVGLMLRESLEDNSKNVALLFNPRMGVRLSARSRKAQSSTHSGTLRTEADSGWLKLVRKGDTLTGYHSADGESWTPVGVPLKIELPNQIFAGVAVTAGNRDGSVNHTSLFDHVEVKGAAAAPDRAGMTTPNLMDKAEILLSSNPSSPQALWSPQLSFTKPGVYDITLKAAFTLDARPAAPMLTLKLPRDLSEWSVNGKRIIAPPNDTFYPVLEGIPSSALQPGANMIQASFKHRVELRDGKLLRDSVGDFKLDLRPADLRTFDIRTGPVLGAAGYDYFTVGCRTRMPATVTLHCDGRTWTSKPGVIHRLRATGLKEGTAYKYKLVADLVGGEATAESKLWTVTTLSRKGPWTFVAMGDARNNPKIWGRISQEVLKKKPQFLMHTGDIIGNGNQYDAWDFEFATPAAEMLATIPCFYTFGNHENNVSMIYDLFGFPQDDRSSYRQRIGPVEIYALNRFENWGAGSPNLVRMESELQESTAPFIFAFTHPPAWTSGPHGNDLLGKDVHFPLFDKYGVTALLAGHDHCYERSEPGRTTMLITGGGGAHLYNPDKAKENPHSKIYRSEYNFLLFETDGVTCKMDAYAYGGLNTPDDQRELKKIDTRTWTARKQGAR